METQENVGKEHNREQTLTRKKDQRVKSKQCR